MSYTIEEMPKSPIAYMRQVGPYGAGNYQLMERLKEWAEAHDLLTGSAVILGVSHDNPGMTPPEFCRYDVCIMVDDDWSIKDGNGEVWDVKEGDLPGGRYAIFTIPHTAEAVRQMWGEVFHQLSAQGQQADISRPIMERYIPEMLDKHLCEICVPIFTDKPNHG